MTASRAVALAVAAACLLPGTCYHADTIATVLLTVADQPDLAACFVDASP